MLSVTLTGKLRFHFHSLPQHPSGPSGKIHQRATMRNDGDCELFLDVLLFLKLKNLEKFDLRLGPHDPDNIIHIARIFVAMSKCTERLHSPYGGPQNFPKTPLSIVYSSLTVDPPEFTIETTHGSTSSPLWIMWAVLRSLRPTGSTNAMTPGVVLQVKPRPGQFQWGAISLC